MSGPLPTTTTAGSAFPVRQASAQDLPALLRMKAASWREAYGHLRPESFFETAEASMDRQLAHWRQALADGTRLWLAEDADGACVGMAASSMQIPDPAASPAGPAGPERELTAIYVLARAQGSGVADQLMQQVLGGESACLWVLAENPRARAFYRRHGFHDDGAPVALDGAWAGLEEQRMVRAGSPASQGSPGGTAAGTSPTPTA